MTQSTSAEVLSQLKEVTKATPPPKAIKLRLITHCPLCVYEAVLALVPEAADT